MAGGVIGEPEHDAAMTAPDDVAPSTIVHFSLSNPAGPGQGSVPALLRRLAEELESRGDVDVQDVVFHSEVTEDEDDLTMTVYFNPRPRRR